VQTTFLRNLFQKERLQRSPSLKEEVHEAIAVQEVFKNRFLGQGEAFFLDQEGAGLADDLICPDPVGAIFGTGPTEQALGKNLVKTPAEITIFFPHPFN
jgi:hypothetical protein